MFKERLIHTFKLTILFLIPVAAAIGINYFMKKYREEIVQFIESAMLTPFMQWLVIIVLAGIVLSLMLMILFTVFYFMQWLFIEPLLSSRVNKKLREEGEND